MCSVGRTMAVDDSSEIVFRSLKERCRSNRFFLALSAELNFGGILVDDASVR